jgi:hypothetical protein
MSGNAPTHAPLVDAPLIRLRLDANGALEVPERFDSAWTRRCAVV